MDSGTHVFVDKQTDFYKSVYHQKKSFLSCYVKVKLLHTVALKMSRLNDQLFPEP